MKIFKKEGYVKMRADWKRYLPPIIDEKEMNKMLNYGLYDKVEITIKTMTTTEDATRDDIVQT